MLRWEERAAAPEVARVTPPSTAASREDARLSVPGCVPMSSDYVVLSWMIPSASTPIPNAAVRGATTAGQ